MSWSFHLPYLEQLISNLDALLSCQTVITDRGHKDAPLAALLNGDPQRLLTLLHLDTAGLTHLRSGNKRKNHQSSLTLAVLAYIFLGKY